MHESGGFHGGEAMNLRNEPAAGHLFLHVVRVHRRILVLGGELSIGEHIALPRSAHAPSHDCLALSRHVGMFLHVGLHELGMEPSALRLVHATIGSLARVEGLRINSVLHEN